jgi:hypothetical protein
MGKSCPMNGGALDHSEPYIHEQNYGLRLNFPHGPGQFDKTKGSLGLCWL